MTGRTGRNLSDLWEFAGKSPVVNFTVHRNYSSVLDVDSILPNLITSPEYTDLIMKVPSELWTLKTTTGIPLQEMDEEMFTRHAEEIDKPGQRIFPTMVPLDLPAISKMRQEKASTSSEGLISKVQTLLSTQLPPAIQGIASKEHKIFPTKIVETIAQKRPMLSDEVSLQPQNALREYSVSFLGQKTQEVSSLKLPGWTTIAALEMLQRPYTVMPLWTGQTNEIARDSITEKIPATYVDVSPMERGSSPKISSLTKYGRVDAVHTLLKTTPSTQHGIPIEISPLRVDSDLLQKQHDAATVKMLLGTTRGKISTPTATVTSLDSLLPQVKPTTERQKVFVPLYTQSRCRHAKLMVTTPPASPVFPKVNSCLMELCRFFQQCLCISQEQYSRHKKKRSQFRRVGRIVGDCTIREMRFDEITHKFLQRHYPADLVADARKTAHDVIPGPTTHAQESGISPILPELTDLPLTTAENFTFNGVFKNIDDVTSFLECLGSHFTWLQVIFTNFPALLNFVSKLKCVTGLCPKDLENYGCACRYELEGLAVDQADSCCFQHRKCYEEALEMDCTWDPSQVTAETSCLTKNLTCESGHECEKLLCSCDKAAIECFVNTHINSSMKGMDITFCPDPVTVSPETTVKKNDVEVKSQQNRSMDVPYVPQREGEQVALQSDATAFPSAEELTTPLKTSTIHRSTPSPEPSAGTSPPPNIGPTRSGFKIAEESTFNSLVSLVTENEVGETIEQVCDRFHYQQLKEDGSVKMELPLLGEMLYCLTGRCPEVFEVYGCYCGHEGRGRPKDLMDNCCFAHKCCLEHLRKIGCNPDKNVRSEVVCIDFKPTCVGWSICDRLLCACDKVAAECMATAPLNATLRSLSRRKCQGEQQPLCRDGSEEDKSDRSIGLQSDSASSEESSEEQRPMRDIVQGGDGGSPVQRGSRRTRSLVYGRRGN
ncbi:uncharacterized protein [Hyperolius riggenbachi]|uniref:uncharacterized protein n=1 Tax=Hyperolius riggenbachi TaxID=752182 RepID=UPI0035A28A62